jgi:lysophospholipase L1-like esterase
MVLLFMVMWSKLAYPRCMKRLLILLTVLCFPLRMVAGEAVFLPDVKRVLFLGDSITYAGEYILQIDGYLRTRFPKRELMLINAGLPSETVSGLSEDGHADGRFPRPVLRERLERVLDLVKPDLVVACYGINCGIYLPHDIGRMEKFQSGIRHLHDTVTAQGAKMVHLTPALFDNGPPPADLGYDDVLQRYSEWLLLQRETRQWQVGDVHGAMRADLTAQRAREPDFRYAGDGVHVSAAGHHAIARTVVATLAPDLSADFDRFFAHAWIKSPEGVSAMAIVGERATLLRNAVLSTAGHLRPGIGKGLPFGEALLKAEALALTIPSWPQAPKP